MNEDNVFKALSSAARRKILAYLSATPLTAGEIAERFDMSKPAISKHLSVLSGAGLVKEHKQGQYVTYSLVEDNITNTLNSFVAEVCPIGGPIKRESRRLAKKKKAKKKN